MELQSRARWAQYSRANDEMFAVTDIKQAPWYVVNAENMECARLNVIRHLLSLIPNDDLTPEPMRLPPLDKTKCVRPPIEDQNFVPEVYRRQINSKNLGFTSSAISARFSLRPQRFRVSRTCTKS